MRIDNLRGCHCSGSTLWKVTDWSNAIFMDYSILYNQVLAFIKSLVYGKSRQNFFLKAKTCMNHLPVMCSQVQVL